MGTFLIFIGILGHIVFLIFFIRILLGMERHTGVTSFISLGYCLLCVGGWGHALSKKELTEIHEERMKSFQQEIVDAGHGEWIVSDGEIIGFNLFKEE